MLAYAFNHIEDKGRFWITCSLGHRFDLEMDDNDGFWMQVENVSVWLDQIDLDDLREKVNRFRFIGVNPLFQPHHSSLPISTLAR